MQLRARSEDDADDELLSVAVVKNGNKAVTGSQTGVLSLYSWGYFKDCSDRFPGMHNLGCPGVSFCTRYKALRVLETFTSGTKWSVLETQSTVQKRLRHLAIH